MTDPFVSAACRGLAALNPPDRLLLAVSGGADSMALLDALHAGRARKDLRRLVFVVGHLDHGLRPDSGRDRDLVVEAARERGLPVVHRRAVGLRGRPNLEEAAREARYEALTEMATANGCGALVTAHTATDQAETLLWRLARGAGARGLGAMPSSRALGGLHLLRPLLGTTREETRAYCRAHRVPFHDDPTNEDARPRARLRAEVLPVLERLAPGATRRLAQAAARLRDDDAWLEAAAAEAARGQPRASLLAGLAPAVRRRASVQWAQEVLGTRRRLSSTHISALERLVMTRSGEVELPASASARNTAVLHRGSLCLVVHPRRAPP